MTREYGQYCGLARALDLVGGRWSLLIVRDLLTGPKRFTELEQGLPGIPTNILSSRLRELEEAGLAERMLQPRPSSSVVYQLTDYGMALEEPVLCLGLWGARSLGKPRESDFVSCSSLALALRAMFRQVESEGVDLEFEIQFGDQHLYGSVHDGRLTVPIETLPEPHLKVEAAVEALSGLFTGQDDIESAVVSGRVQIDGPISEARGFFEIFRLPSSMPTTV